MNPARSPFVRFFVLVLIAPAAAAQHWESRLDKGNRVSVDPTTNRPIVTTGRGLDVPLWDGVHRLEDGSSITVRSGVMVPNADLLEMRRGQQPEVSPLAKGPSPCVVLQRKTCGLHNECAKDEACRIALQLVKFQREEEQEHLARGFRQTPGQCREALRDDGFFNACAAPQMAQFDTPCYRLVLKVCGALEQCSGAPSCGPARQLVQRELEERRVSFHPDAATYTTGECRKALADQGFFLDCEGS